VVILGYKKQSTQRTKSKPSAEQILRQFQSPEITRALAEFHAQFAQYALPDAETRKLVSEAMGTMTLTEALQAMRDER
jgi:hypothetical protein